MIKKSLIAMAALGLVTLSATAGDVVNINEASEKAELIAKEDLGKMKVMTEESLGLRKTNLYAEDADTVGETTDYSRPAAGQSKRFARAFTNAPPMIPHDVEGMLPITTKANMCLDSHMPAVAPSVKATAIPASHFASFRPDTALDKDGKITKNGKAVDNTSDFLTVTKKSKDLSKARYNCSQCHAPQSKIEPLVGNTFTPDFGDSGLDSKSNLIDVIDDGVK